MERRIYVLLVGPGWAFLCEGRGMADMTWEQFAKSLQVGGMDPVNTGSNLRGPGGFFDSLGRQLGVQGSTQTQFDTETVNEGGQFTTRTNGYKMSPELMSKLASGGYKFRIATGTKHPTVQVIDQSGKSVGSFEYGDGGSKGDAILEGLTKAGLLTVAGAGLGNAAGLWNLGAPAGSAGSAGAAGAAGQAAGATTAAGAAGAGVDAGIAAGMEAAGSAFTPEAMAAWGQSAGLGVPSAAGAGGLTGAAAAPGVFNAAVDSQLASAGLGITGAQSAAGAAVPEGVTLVNAGGVMGTAAGGAAGLSGAAKTGAGALLNGVLGTSGNTGDMLWNLGKAGIALAGAGAAANGLAPKIDTSGAASGTATIQDIAAKQLKLADETYASQKAILEKYTPMIDQLLTTQLGAQQDSLNRSTSTWADYEKLWKPVAAQLAQKAQDYNNKDYVEAEAARAGADAATQFDRAAAESERALVAAGASPEKIAAIRAAGGLTAAKAIGGATSLGRRSAQQTGLNLLGQATAQGNQVAQQSKSLSGLAAAQGAGAQAGLSSAVNLNATPANTAANLLSGAAQTNNAATNSLLQQQQLEANATNARNGLLGDIIGAGATLIGQNGGLASLFKP